MEVSEARAHLPREVVVGVAVGPTTGADHRTEDRETPVLNITDNAQEVVKGLTTREGLPDTAGLRLALADDQTQLEVTVVSQPEPTDQVVTDSSDATVYVAENATQVLDDQTLDATPTPDGVGFTLAPQSQQPA